MSDVQTRAGRVREKVQHVVARALALRLTWIGGAERAVLYPVFLPPGFNGAMIKHRGQMIRAEGSVAPPTVIAAIRSCRLLPPLVLAALHRHEASSLAKVVRIEPLADELAAHLGRLLSGHRQAHGVEGLLIDGVELDQLGHDPLR